MHAYVLELSRGIGQWQLASRRIPGIAVHEVCIEYAARDTGETATAQYPAKANLAAVFCSEDGDMLKRSDGKPDNRLGSAACQDKIGCRRYCTVEAEV